MSVLLGSSKVLGDIDNDRFWVWKANVATKSGAFGKVDFCGSGQTPQIFDGSPLTNRIGVSVSTAFLGQIGLWNSIAPQEESAGMYWKKQTLIA